MFWGRNKQLTSTFTNSLTKAQARPDSKVANPIPTVTDQPESGSDSPRTIIANELHELAIGESADSVQATPNGRKRPRRNSILADHDIQEFDFKRSRSPSRLGFENSSSPRAFYSLHESPVFEIKETPSIRLQRLPTSPPITPSKSRGLRFADEEPPLQAASTSPPSRSVLRSPPPPSDIQIAADPTASPLSSQDCTSPNQTVLTWQPHEITGHDIDMASPDDDGEGINGIGFKPTPAIAYARSQRRKQQVGEWRAREAREARQRRLDRRRGAERFDPLGGVVQKRSVRFVGGA